MAAPRVLTGVSSLWDVKLGRSKGLWSMTWVRVIPGHQGKTLPWPEASYNNPNTLYRVRKCIPKRAASFMPQHILRSQKCSRAVRQRTLTSLHCQSCTCGTAQGHTGNTIPPLLASCCHFFGPWTPAKVTRKERREPKMGQVESKLMAQTMGHLDRN